MSKLSTFSPGQSQHPLTGEYKNFARDAGEAAKIEKLGRSLGVDEGIRARFEDGVPAADLLF